MRIRATSKWLFLQCVQKLSQFSAACNWPPRPKARCKPKLKLPPSVPKARLLPFCKSDAALADERTLGVYIRCGASYRREPLECLPPCHDTTRLDYEMYRPSQKLSRNYSRTWVECIGLKPKKKKQKCTTVPYEHRFRPRRKRHSLCCPQPSCRLLNPIKCRKLSEMCVWADKRCPKILVCECPASRINPRCKAVMKPRKHSCRKRTRYPSFSECQHDKLTESKKECTCLQTSLCEMWRSFHHLRKLKLYRNAVNTKST